MTKEVQISIKMEPELRDQFRAATALHHRPAAQVMRELMRHYISNTQIPNALTADTLRKSKNGEEVSKPLIRMTCLSSWTFDAISKLHCPIQA